MLAPHLVTAPSCADRLPRATEQGFISQYMAYKVYSSKFYSISHNLLHAVAASWMASYLADHVCAWWRPSRLPALRVARLIHDPPSRCASAC